MSISTMTYYIPVLGELVLFCLCTIDRGCVDHRNGVATNRMKAIYLGGLFGGIGINIDADADAAPRCPRG